MGMIFHTAWHRILKDVTDCLMARVRRSQLQLSVWEPSQTGMMGVTLY